MDPIGRIEPSIPLLQNPAIDPVTGKLSGLIAFFNSLLVLIFIAAGIWAFINFILAGFRFLNAGGDPKAVASAWERIWQTILGLFIIVGSFVLAAIVGVVLYGDPTAILQPKIQ